MEQVRAILQLASSRAAARSLPYSGAVLPSEAYYLMHHLEHARLVDVRTEAEWQFVGIVPEALCLEWRSFPGMVRNEAFIDALRAQCALHTPLLLLCRSGARSDEAARAAQDAGFTTVFNVLEGFEGERDSSQQRGRVNGWKVRGLPWVQG
jgi:rhodanese-related sulfurtransferase